MGKREKIVLLDRDGVFNRDRSDYVKTPEELIILPGIPGAVARLTRAGYRILVVTNQAGVGKGLIAPQTLAAIHDLLREKLAVAGGRIDAVYHCPHRNEDRCDCRKPAPGMIRQAQREWGFDPARTWFAGDTLRDLHAGRAAGCQPALLLTGHGSQVVGDAPSDVPVFADLPAFAAFLLASDAAG